MDNHSRIYVAGGATLLGRALRKRLPARGFTGVIDEPEPALTQQRAVTEFVTRTRPEYVFVVGGKTAGTAGNQASPADLMFDNLSIVTNVIPAAWAAHAQKLLYVASSCVYPKAAPQPFHVSALGTGPLEP